MNIHTSIYTAIPENAGIAAEIIRSGGVVVLPTDTIYALSADGCNEDAVQSIYKIKNRSAEKFLPMFVENKEMAEEYVEVSWLSQHIMSTFWPGALTMVLPAKKECKIAGSAYNKKDIGVRSPDHEFIQSVIHILGHPIVGTSANMSGAENARDVEQIYKSFLGKVPAIFIDETLSLIGHSTIIDTYGDKVNLIRDGIVALESIEESIRVLYLNLSKDAEYK